MLNIASRGRGLVESVKTFANLIRLVQDTKVPLAEREGAFATVVTGFSDASFRQAYKLLGDAALAEDAVQEAFLTAYTNIDQLHDAHAFPNWLRKIVRTACLRLIRRKRHPTMSLDELPEHPTVAQDPAATVEQREQAAIIRAAIAALPETDRTVLSFFYYQGYALAEVSVLLGCPLVATKKRLQYARQRLREVIARSSTTEETLRLMGIGALPRQLRIGLLADALAESEQAGIDDALRLEGVTSAEMEEWNQAGCSHWLTRLATDVVCDLLLADGWDAATPDAAGISLLALVEQRGSVKQRRILQRFLRANAAPPRATSGRRREG